MIAGALGVVGINRVLCVGALAAGALLVAGCDEDIESPSVKTEYDLPANVRSLKVDGEVGKVTVTAEAGTSKISVVENRSEHAEPTHTATGGDATLAYTCSDDANCRVDYDITLPARVALDVDNTAGEVNLSGPMTQVVAKAEAGQIQGTELGGGSFDVSTDAGEIDLAFAAPPRSVKATTQVGNTNVTVPSGATYQINAEASVGDTSVDVPNDPSSNRRIEAKTDAGSISIKQG
jgi:putative adhesin